MIEWGNIIEGTLIERSNRFLALVEVGGKVERAYVANSGRMAELMVSGVRVFVLPVARAEGHTQFDLKLVDHGGVLVSVDTRTPNDLLHGALLTGSLAEFRDHTSTRREVTYSPSKKDRFDFALDGPAGPCLVEAKSVTLVKNGRGLFPDAPTERGARHLNTLRQAVNEGRRAAVVFIIQRPDVHSFSPNDEMDPVFGRALREAVIAGVEAYAFRCRVGLEGIAIEGRVPILL